MQNLIEQAEAIAAKYSDVLNHQQQKALKIMIRWYFGGSKHSKLSGYAGTGKTYLAGIFCKILLELIPTIKIKCIAPSHKAKKQIARSLSNQSINNLDFGTVAQQLGKSPQLDKSSGKEKFVRKEKGLFAEPEIDLLLCDEYGMIGEEDSTELLSYDFPHKTLFLGDPAQLPPVGEKYSYIASFTDWPQAQLTDVVRYSGDLKDVAYSYIGPSNVGGCLPIESEDGSIITLRNKATALQCFAEDLAIAFETKNFDYCKWIAWRNKSAYNASVAVRNIIFENPELPYLPSDRLLARKPIQRINPDSGKWEIVIENSTEFTVASEPIPQLLTVDLMPYEYWEVPALSDEGQHITLNILAEGQDQFLSDHLKRVKAIAQKTKKWDVWVKLSKAFDDVSYAYAITCHKSQGSTYDYVFLDLPDLKACPDRKQIIYTAMTRTAKVCHVFNL
jgi:exodeoxyribonuclease V